MRSSSASHRCRTVVVGTGEVEPVEHGARVERGPSDEHGRDSAASELGDERPGPLLERRDVGALGDVEQVEQVVRDAPALVDGHLRGADVHPGVQLHGVGVDHLTAETLGQVERQPGLAGRRRTDDGHYCRSTHVASVATTRTYEGAALPEELGVGFLDDAKDKVKDLLEGHEDKVDDGIEKAGDLVDDKTGGKYEDKVDIAQEKAGDALDSLDGKDDAPA